MCDIGYVMQIRHPTAHVLHHGVAHVPRDQDILLVQNIIQTTHVRYRCDHAYPWLADDQADQLLDVVVVELAELLEFVLYAQRELEERLLYALYEDVLARESVATLVARVR